MASSQDGLPWSAVGVSDIAIETASFFRHRSFICRYAPIFDLFNSASVSEILNLFLNMSDQIQTFTSSRVNTKGLCRTVTTKRFCRI